MYDFIFSNGDRGSRGEGHPAEKTRVVFKNFFNFEIDTPPVRRQRLKLLHPADIFVIILKQISSQPPADGLRPPASRPRGLAFGKNELV